jgi:hypothetical protein
MVLPLARVYLSYIIMSFVLFVLEGGEEKSSSRIESNIDTQTSP